MFIASYHDFCTQLLEAGFTLAGPSDEGVFSLSTRFGPNISWHTEDPDTDPWEWRMRVLTERNDIAYAKLFFRKSGYITRAWYPYFLAVRNQGRPFADAYAAGMISHDARRIFALVEEDGPMPIHALKTQAGFGKQDQSRFNRALLELQERMYLTICASASKLSQTGAAYGWPCTVFCTTEQFFGPQPIAEARAIAPDAAADRIARQTRALHPAVDEAKLFRFLRG